MYLCLYRGKVYIREVSEKVWDHNSGAGTRGMC